MTLLVSVVVPTFRRPDSLERCLAALLKQTFAPTDYEIIIVDDAASEHTRQQVACWAKHAEISGPIVRYLSCAHASSHGPAVARNAGWRAAQGEIIAFTDDDCLPAPTWLQAGVTALKQGQYVGATGRVLVPLSGTPTDYEYNASHLERSQFVTANSFYRHSILERVGGFDERFTAPWREDTDLFFTLRAYNFPLTSTPEAIVHHPIRPAHWGVSLQQQRKSMFNALLYKKHPLLYRKEIQAAPPWRYYGMLGALCVAAMGLFISSPLLLGVGLVLWFALTALFCVERLRHTSHAPKHVVEMVVTSILIPPLCIFWRLRGAIKFRVFFL